MTWTPGLWARTIVASGLSVTDRAVAQALGIYADREGTSAYPGVKRLASDVGVSTRTISRSLVRLRAAGLAMVTSRADRVRGKADVYRLIISAKVRAKSSDTGGAPTVKAKSFRKGFAPESAEIDQSTASVQGLNGWERRKVNRMAVALADGGLDLDVIVQAITAPMPTNTRSVAGVLHGRLRGLDERTTTEARAWLANRLRAVQRGTQRRTAPRPASHWGPTSLVVGSW